MEEGVVLRIDTRWERGSSGSVVLRVRESLELCK